jgi:hypothetical protein
MVEMDDRMDAKGYLRLCTKEQTMRLMGNAISKEVAELAQAIGIAVQPAEMTQKSKGLLSHLTRNRAIRFLMQSVVNKFYQWLNQ